MNNLCNYPMVDDTTLTWDGNVLTTVEDGAPVPATSKKLAPCSGFYYNDDVFEAQGNVLTVKGKDTVVAVFNVCGGVGYDADVFATDGEGTIAMLGDEDGEAGLDDDEDDDEPPTIKPGGGSSSGNDDRTEIDGTEDDKKKPDLTVPDTDD